MNSRHRQFCELRYFFSSESIVTRYLKKTLAILDVVNRWRTMNKLKEYKVKIEKKKLKRNWTQASPIFQLDENNWI